MSECKTFNGVTPAVFECVKATSKAEHGTVYDPADANQGTATTNIPAIGTIVLTFNLNTSNDSIQYCIKSKPWIVSAGQIFGGIGDTINGCSKK